MRFEFHANLGTSADPPQMRRGPTDRRTLSVATADYFAVSRRHMRTRLYTNAWTLGRLQLFMEKMSCELLLHDYPKISEVVFNSFLSYTAIRLNIATIHAMRKTLSLPKTLKTLLLSLAVSDIGVGLLSQPFYTLLLVKWLQQKNPDCKTYMMFTVIIGVSSVASFFCVVAVSVDRFLAIHLHLRNQELVTHKRVVAVVITIWLLSVFFPSMISWTTYDTYYLVEFLLGVLSLVLQQQLTSKFT